MRNDGNVPFVLKSPSGQSRQLGLESQKHHAVAVPEYNWISVNKFGQNLLKCQLRSQRLGR